MSEFPCHVSVESELPLSAKRVWARVSTMVGVNDELRPWVWMTLPHAARGMRLECAPVGERLFESWILLGRILPIDRHAFALEAVETGHFRERSTSWLHAVWCHERWVIATPSGCRVVDEVRFRPRLSLMNPVLQWIVHAVFEHRHRRLLRWAQTR